MKKLIRVVILISIVGCGVETKVEEANLTLQTCENDFCSYLINIRMSSIYEGELTEVYWEPALSEIAQSHLSYILANLESTSLTYPSVHLEEKGKEGYTGDNLIDRLKNASVDVSNRFFSEVIIFKRISGNYQTLLETMVSNPYTRQAVLEPNLYSVGLATDGTINIVIFSGTFAQSDSILVWPPPSSNIASTSYTHLVDGFCDTSYYSPSISATSLGYPISIHFPTSSISYLSSEISIEDTGSEISIVDLTNGSSIEFSWLGLGGTQNYSDDRHMGTVIYLQPNITLTSGDTYEVSATLSMQLGLEYTSKIIKWIFKVQ